jgi:hypothetical protein
MVFHTESKDEFGNDLIIIKTVGGTLYCFTGIDHPSPVVKHPTKSPDYEAEPITGRHVDTCERKRQVLYGYWCEPEEMQLII